MRISRFYIDANLQVDTQIDAPKELAHYMSKVLRLTLHCPIILFNGDGSEYPSEIIDIDKRRVTILVNSQISISKESPLYVHLGQGISKGDRMDIAIQKSVELGVSEITPIITENCNVKLDKDRWEKKHLSWTKLIIAACEQSQRNVLPKLNMPVTMNEWLGQHSQLDKLIITPGAKTYLSSLSKPRKGFRIIIGPEGGLSEQEVYTATETGYISCNMGSRILRTETAAVAAIAILQSCFGDL